MSIGVSTDDRIKRVAGGVDTDRLDEVVECDDGACPLAHPHGLAVTDQVDHLADQHFDGVRIVAERSGGGLEPGNVAVMVGAEHVDAEVETTLPLVEVVGEIGGDVGRLAVALDHDAVLVVTKLGGAQPCCAVLLVDVAGLAQPCDGLLDSAAGVHRVFVGVDVEVGAEVVQRLLDVAEHQIDTDGPEGLVLLFVGLAQRVGCFLEHLRGDVGDVVARVAVLRGGYPLAAAISELVNRSICAPWSLK